MDISNGLKVTALPFSYANTVKDVASFKVGVCKTYRTTDMQMVGAFNASFVKHGLKRLCDIKSIIYMDAEGQNISVTDKATIREFLENTENTTGKEIEEFINGVNSKGVKNEVLVTCSNEECKNEYMAPINFDPVNFFTAS